MGLPSWNVEVGVGSFITMEFGEPHLHVTTVQRRHTYLADAPAETEQRGAWVRGQWHLWIYCCRWSLTLHDAPISHHETTPPTMSRALRLLNGQMLTDVQVSDDATTTFTFDLGCVLTTRPAPLVVYDGDVVEQWFLYQPSGEVLALWGDGRVSRSSEPRAPGDRESSETEPVARPPSDSTPAPPPAE
jgi:hypothetical protein